MAIQSDETLVTKGDLKTLYTDKILPYLGGNISLSTNISDSYSTDEKIVGIWLDGKPLYQKTFIGDISTPRYNCLINHNISNAEWKNLFGGFTNSNASSFQPFQYNWINNTGGQGGSPTTSYASANVGLSSTKINIRIVTGEIEDCTKYIVTLQYTKSTDTASSALTTPGCYDLNRPDLWPNGQEIFFGNGLYGMRKAGTAAANNLQSGILLVSNVSKTACCYNKGGMIDMSGTNGTNWYDINGGWDNKGAQRQFNPLITNTNQTFRFYCQDNQNYTTQNIQYNIWFTYTK